jgi:hypothetical protein
VPVHAGFANHLEGKWLTVVHVALIISFGLWVTKQPHLCWLVPDDSINNNFGFTIGNVAIGPETGLGL